MNRSDKQNAFFGARRRSDLIGNFKEPVNTFCSELLWNSVASENHTLFQMIDFDDLTRIDKYSGVKLDEEIEKAMIRLASLLASAQRREIETIKSYYNETTSKN